MILDDIQTTLPGSTMLCGDYNARGELWGNRVTNPQGEALEDALDRCYLTCINDGRITRKATRPGDTDSIIDLALTTLQLAEQCTFKVLEPQDNDHIPWTVLVKRSKDRQRKKRANAFTYSKKGDDPVTKLRAKKTSGGPKRKQTREQPPWFTAEVEDLWKKKRTACKKSQRNRDNQQLREAAKTALKAFENKANEEKERLYEEFSKQVTLDKTLHKFGNYTGP